MCLRDRTADAHASLDQLVGPFDTLDSYRRYVRGIAAFRLPLEAKLASVVWSEIAGGYRYQRLSDLLVEDIADLGLAPVPVAAPQPAALSFDELVGTLYVLEGSALGSRILYRRAQALGLTAGQGARHLAVQSQASEQWQSFLALLEAVPLDMELVIKSAIATFQAAENAFSDLDLR